MSTISEVAIVVLTESSFHLVLLSVTEVTVVSLKKAIAITKNIAVTGLPSLFKSITKTINQVVVSAVTIAKSITFLKVITRTVTGTVSILKNFFFFKLLSVTVTSTASIARAFLRTLSVLVVSTATLLRRVGKLLAVISTSIVQLFPAIIQKFGAVAKFTFIVGPKKLMTMVVKDRDILVEKADKTLTFVKNRVIMLWKKHG